MNDVACGSWDVDGLSVFCREAGPKDAPTLLLLLGLPSSSRTYETSLRRLGASCHLIAPDYIGFRHSAAPSPMQFPYKFDRVAEAAGQFAAQPGFGWYSLFLQNYSAPVDFRLAMAHPERMAALIVQNAVAHEERLGTLPGYLRHSHISFHGRTE